MNTNTEGNDNPYQATDVALEPYQSSKRRVIHSPFVLSVQWTVVLLCNSVVPLLIGWTEAQQGQGQFGIILAMGLCLVLGYVACIYIPLFALIATRGGFLVRCIFGDRRHWIDLDRDFLLIWNALAVGHT